MSALLEELTRRNILLELVDGRLKLYTKNGCSVPPELLDLIREKKEELTGFLQSGERGSGQPNAETGIPSAAWQADYSLSFSQERLWALSQDAEASRAFHMAGIYSFEGRLDDAALSRSFSGLIDRHEALRTVFRVNSEGQVRQVVLPAGAPGFYIRFQDLREDGADQLEVMLKDDLLSPFDLGKGPLLRATLYHIEEANWVFSYCMHHIVSDGWSMNVLIRDLLLFYGAYSRGVEPSLVPLSLQFKDFAEWQRTTANTYAVSAHRAYWLRQLGGTLPVLDLAPHRPRPARRTYNGSVETMTIDSARLQRFEAGGRDRGATLFMSLFSAVLVLLYHHTGDEDIIVGTPLASRERPELEDQIGFYLNTVALRVRFGGNDTFGQLLQKVRQVTLDAFEHGVYPLSELLDALPYRRDASRSFLYDAWIVLNSAGYSGVPEQFRADRLAVRQFRRPDIIASRYDLLFGFTEGEGLTVNFEYNTDILERSEVTRLIDRFGLVLEKITANPGSTLREIADELQQVERERQQAHLQAIRSKNLQLLKNK
ncbi:MAG: hypothetical protein JST68_25940 [Bacteroidetes bacterium]|nr:hypothetical protein [Bacteroidota bacterium]